MNSPPKNAKARVAAGSAQSDVLDTANHTATETTAQPARPLLGLLVASGIPISLADDLVRWKQAHPNVHIGAWGSHILGRLMREAKQKAAA